MNGLKFQMLVWLFLQQLLAVEDDTKPSSCDDLARLTTVAPTDMEEKVTPNSAISLVPGLTLSHGVPSPPTTVPQEADSRAVNTNSLSVDEDSVSDHVRDDQQPGKSNGDEIAPAQDVSLSVDGDGKNLDLLNPFGDELDADMESNEQISSKYAVRKQQQEPNQQQQELNQQQEEPSQQQQEPNQQQQLTGAADTFSEVQVTEGGGKQMGSLTARVVSPNAPASLLDTDLHVPLTPLSPDATLPSCQDNKEFTSLVAEALPVSLYDDQCKTSDSALCEGSKNLVSTDNEVLPVGVEDTVPCGQGENLSTNMGMQPQTPSQHQATPSRSDVRALSSAELSLKQRLREEGRKGGERAGKQEEREEGYKKAGKQDEFAAVREMMDLTAADLMIESQLLGAGEDEATVPSCSPVR